MLDVTKQGKTVEKPKALIDYNINKSDTMISFNESTRKTRKWYMKLFFHTIDICVLNSYNIFKLHNNSKISLLGFRINLIRQILETHHLSEERVAVQRPLGPNASTHCTCPFITSPTPHQPNKRGKCKGNATYVLIQFWRLRREKTLLLNIMYDYAFIRV